MNIKVFQIFLKKTGRMFTFASFKIDGKPPLST